MPRGVFQRPRSAWQLTRTRRESVQVFSSRCLQARDAWDCNALTMGCSTRCGGELDSQATDFGLCVVSALPEWCGHGFGPVWAGLSRTALEFPLSPERLIGILRNGRGLQGRGATGF